MKFSLPLRWLVCVLAMCGALSVVIAPAASAEEVVGVRAPISDNYKAAYNADPSQPEHRIWLSMSKVVASGTTWAPTAPGAISFSGNGSLTVHGADGRTGVLSISIVRGGLSMLQFRSDPTGRWGVFASVNDPNALVSQSALVHIALKVGGTELAAGTLEYRHDASMDGVPASDVEYNGPRGRWWIGGTAVKTDTEQGTPNESLTLLATYSSSAAPKVAKIVMPLRTSSRIVPVKVYGRAAGGVKITSIRFAIGAGKFSVWQRVKPSHALRLAARNATWKVRVQLRDARARTSPIASRYVRCNCG